MKGWTEGSWTKETSSCFFAGSDSLIGRDWLLAGNTETLTEGKDGGRAQYAHVWTALPYTGCGVYNLNKTIELRFKHS